MKIYIFGNGNIKFADFEALYVKPIKRFVNLDQIEFIVGDFRGVDTLAMEYLKHESKNVRVLHIGKRPRYFPDKYNTLAAHWELIGGFEDDQSRDQYAIDHCSHFVATDFYSSTKRQSGTQRIIDLCLALNKTKIDE